MFKTWFKILPEEEQVELVIWKNDRSHLKKQFCGRPYVENTKVIVT